MKAMQVFLQSKSVLSLSVKAGLIFLLSFASYWLVKHFVLAFIKKLTKESQNKWDDVLEKHRVFGKLAYLAPAMVWYFGIKLLLPDTDMTQRIVLLFVLYNIVALLSRLFDGLQEIFETHQSSRGFSIKGYIQSIKLFLYFSGTLLAIAILLKKPVTVLLSGIGALTAILVLVFRDTILSTIASIQITSNDMFRVGDWIEMPKFGADGEVIDIALHKVKIQNWDKTIVTIPTFKFIDESFKNWRGMTQSGGRRIMRTIYIDQTSVRFCDSQLLERFGNIHLLKDYIETKAEELAQYNNEGNFWGSSVINGRKLTNLGTFRAYAQTYLETNPDIHKDHALLVRHRPPGPEGIGIQIYAFTNVTDWVQYETIQADIFDHLLSALPEFDLRVFQEPTGADMARFIAHQPSHGDIQTERNAP